MRRIFEGVLVNQVWKTEMLLVENAEYYLNEEDTLEENLVFIEGKAHFKVMFFQEDFTQVIDLNQEDKSVHTFRTKDLEKAYIDEEYTLKEIDRIDRETERLETRKSHLIALAGLQDIVLYSL